MVLPKILEDDSLLEMLRLPEILTQNKIGKKISYFFYAICILNFCGAPLIVLLNKEWNLLLSQYTAYVCGGPLIISHYIILYHRSYQNTFENLYYDIFPSLWPLRSLGSDDFNNFQKLAKLTKTVLKIVMVLALVAATGGIPWFGDNYHIILLMKLAVDNFDGWFLQTILIILFLSFCHMALTITGNVFCATYLVMHLYNQIRMLKLRLENLSNSPDLAHAIHDPAYQDFIKTELISCIKLHQEFFRYKEKICELSYYPTFYFSAGGVLIGLALILMPRTTLIIEVRVVFVASVAIYTAIVFCVLGQLLEDESEKIFVSAYNSSWYLWNTKNRQLLCLFILKTQETVVISSSGIITINHELLIKLYQTIYSTFTFLLNVSKAL
ncbi:hypothetical protein Zmor_019704 [Zophobas morio]|uniref:Odorant receptor n=1 Tax=Zophobas morio TaxID=2755281 RepID=A0AA38I683_9CUCU|nr:hypothetical protein Zmor_019704 [Zophobas morio]